MPGLPNKEIVDLAPESGAARMWIAQTGLLCAIVVLPIWAMTPFGFDKFGEIKYGLVMLVALTGVAGFAWWSLVIGGFGVEPGTEVWLVGLLVVQGLFAAMASVDPVRGVVGSPVRYDGYLMILANAAVFLLGYRISTGKRGRVAYLVARLMVVTAFPVWLYAVVQALRLDPIAWESWRLPQGRVFSTLGNPIFLGAFSVMAIVTALILAVASPRRARYAWGAVAGLGSAVVVFTAARASWIALAGGVVLLLLLAWRRGALQRSALALFVAGAVAAGIVAAVIAVTPPSEVGLLSTSATTITQPHAPRNSGRVAIWSISLRMIVDHPVLGVGPDEMGQRFEQYRTEAFNRAEGPKLVADKPHSSLLEWGVETGIPGLVLFVGLVGVVLIGGLLRFRKRAPLTASWPEIALWLAGVVYFAQSLVTVTAIGVDGVWWLLLGVLAAPAAARTGWIGQASGSRTDLIPKPHPAGIGSGPRPARHRAEHGFTLIELLVVIIIIAILAAIAIPTFLGQREKAQDAAAVTLVRNALTVVESAYIDTRDYSAITVGQLSAIEPSFVWNLPHANLVNSSPPSITAAVVSHAGVHGVDFSGQASDRFDVASVSDSGNRYGIDVVSTGAAGASYVKVKVIDGAAVSGW